MIQYDRAGITGSSLQQMDVTFFERPEDDYKVQNLCFTVDGMKTTSKYTTGAFVFINKQKAGSCEVNTH